MKTVDLTLRLFWINLFFDYFIVDHFFVQINFGKLIFDKFWLHSIIPNFLVCDKVNLSFIVLFCYHSGIRIVSLYLCYGLRLAFENDIFYNLNGLICRIVWKEDKLLGLHKINRIAYETPLIILAKYLYVRQLFVSQIRNIILHYNQIHQFFNLRSIVYFADTINATSSNGKHFIPIRDAFKDFECACCFLVALHFIGYFRW